MAALHHPVFLFNKDLGGKRCEPQMVTLSQHGIIIVTVLLPQASVHALTAAVWACQLRSTPFWSITMSSSVSQSMSICVCMFKHIHCVDHVRLDWRFFEGTHAAKTLIGSLREPIDTRQQTSRRRALHAWSASDRMHRIIESKVLARINRAVASATPPASEACARRSGVVGFNRKPMFAWHLGLKSISTCVRKTPERDQACISWNILTVVCPYRDARRHVECTALRPRAGRDAPSSTASGQQTWRRIPATTLGDLLVCVQLPCFSAERRSPTPWACYGRLAASHA